jgi:hypothetical protein
VSGTGVYLYAVAKDLNPSAARGLTGVAGSPVRAVSGTGFTALVSTVGLEEFGEEALRLNLEKLPWLESVARAHHAVAIAAARAAPTAPVRIATVYRTDERVRELLHERGPELTEVLRRVDGRAEWGVKAIASGEETESEPEPTGSARPGTAYLSRKRAQRRTREETSRRLAEQARRIEATLTPYAAASRRHRLQDPGLSGRRGRMTLNIAYLLDHDRSADLLAAARELEEHLPGTHIEVTGPWPAYSFTDWQATP